jgi:multiple sugar transport system ATP-binding protein
MVCSFSPQLTDPVDHIGTGSKSMPYEKATHNSTCPAPATHAVNIHGFLVLNAQRELKITTLYVTHDQTEAMTLGDRIALLKDGSLVQAGTPEEMYEQPKTSFAATFIGSPPMNLVPAKVKEKDNQITLAFGDATVVLPREKAEQAKQLKKQQVIMGIRPEHVTLRSEASDQTLSGTVTAIEPLGREALLHISTKCRDILVLTPEKDRKPDERVHVCFEPNSVHLFGSEQQEEDSNGL